MLTCFGTSGYIFNDIVSLIKMKIKEKSYLK